MKIAPGIEMLELPAVLMSGPGFIFPTLLWDRQETILVDAGFPGMAQQFWAAISQADVNPEKLTRIIVTHHDLDHIGSLAELQKITSGHVEVLAHAEEVPYLQGERLPIKLTPEMREKMAQEGRMLSGEQRQEAKSMNERWKNLKIAVDRALYDGDILPYCGGIQVIHTPGHTPGHICLYLIENKTLIAGDALFVEEGKLVPAPSFINADSEMAHESLKKLSRYDVSYIITYHGGLFRENCNERLAEIGNR